MTASYNPHDKQLPPPPVVIRPARDRYARLERRDPPLGNICKGTCIMTATCMVSCRLAPRLPDPVLPKPPAFPKAYS